MKNSRKESALPTVIGCVLVQLCVGILYLWSVFKSPVVKYYNWTTEAANMVSSYMIFAFVVGSLIGGFLQDKTNPKLVATIGCILFCGGIFITSFLTSATISFIYLTYCVISGLGCGFAYGSILSCMQKWFPHKRGFATGLSAGAFGFSTVIFSPVSNWLLGLYEAPMTFRILSILFFIVSMIACLFIRLPSESYIKSLNLPQASSNQKNFTPKEAMKTLPFWCITISCFFTCGTWNIVLPIMKDLGMERGLSESMAILTVSLTGITNAGGRIIMSSLSDKIGRANTIILLALLTCVCAVSLIGAGGIIYTIIILLTAIGYGGPSATLPALTTDLYGPKYSGTNYGITLLGLGFSSIVFNAISNYLRNLTGTYTASFILAAVSALVPVVLMLLVKRYQKRQSQTASA